MWAAFANLMGNPEPRLYHRHRNLKWVALLGVLVLALGGCRAPQRPPERTATITILAGGERYTVQVPVGSTVADALQAAGVTLGALDRTEPPDYTLIGGDLDVQVVRVSESFHVEQEVIPFERRILHNEALPAGETRLLQAGVNGLREVTYRQVFENGTEVINQPVKSVVVKEPQPEIVMVGVQAPFLPRDIPGRLAYLAAGNAWVMDGNTGQRRPVVTTGDLDGRVFALSPDRRWLLFTRQASGEETLNTLWVADLNSDPPQLLNLGVENIAHFAAFAPYSSLTVYYSTVEPRPGPPGWQANNDLQMVTFSTSGWVSEPREVVEANAGGVYGWWGTTFAWSPQGRLAFARPDAVGEVNLDEGLLDPWLTLAPYQTRADWAWVPGVAWSPDGTVLFAVSHGRPGATDTPETAPDFHLVALPEGLGWPIVLADDVGMFAYPQVSPLLEDGYQVAYLQAAFPQQSDTSRYRLVVMDRDGSNRRVLFPPEGGLGLDPQQVVWSPGPVPDFEAYAIALLYQGNLYLVSTKDGTFQQLTGDGLVTAVSWR